jgi:hypothetical protein
MPAMKSASSINAETIVDAAAVNGEKKQTAQQNQAYKCNAQ